MIYALFFISLGIYFALRTAIAYYEYFGFQQLRKINEKKPEGLQLKLLSRAFLWVFGTAYRPNWVLKGDKWFEWKVSALKGISHFFAIFALAAFFFSILQYWLDHTTNLERASATVFQIEQMQFKIMDTAARFKLNFVSDILLLFLLIFLSGMFPIIEKWKLENKYKKYTKLVTSVLYFLTISTSFTFFGSRFAENEKGRAAKLEQHKLEIITENKLLAKEIREDVTSRIIDQILSNPNVESTLDRMEDISRNIRDAKSDEEYLNFMVIAPKGALNHLQLNTFEDECLKRYNLTELLLEHEQAFQKTYQQSAPKGADFYEANWEKESANFNKGQAKGFDVGNASENSVKEARETFKKGASAAAKKYSKYYAKYKDPLEKIIRKGYSATGEEWIKSFMKTMGVDFPFLDQFLDPIVNSPAEDYVVEKVEAILNAAAKQDGTAVEAILKDCGTEFGNDFAVKLRESEKFSRFNGYIGTDYEKSQRLQEISSEEITAEKAKAKRYFEEHCHGDKFEKYRIDFYDGLKEGRHPLLTGKRKEIVWTALENWEHHKKELILPMYFDKKRDIDSYFFAFFKADPELLVTWAYCLLANEPDFQDKAPADALNYYFNIHQQSYDDYFQRQGSDHSFMIRMKAANDLLCGKKNNR